MKSQGSCLHVFVASGKKKAAIPGLDSQLRLEKHGQRTELLRVNRHIGTLIWMRFHFFFQGFDFDFFPPDAFNKNLGIQTLPFPFG